MEESKYENVIARYSDKQLIIEMNLINEQETILFNQKKAIREELKRRSGGQR